MEINTLSVNTRRRFMSRSSNPTTLLCGQCSQVKAGYHVKMLGMGPWGQWQSMDSRHVRNLQTESSRQSAGIIMSRCLNKKTCESENKHCKEISKTFKYNMDFLYCRSYSRKKVVVWSMSEIEEIKPNRYKRIHGKFKEIALRRNQAGTLINYINIKYYKLYFNK